MIDQSSLYLDFIDKLYFDWLKQDFFKGLIFSSDDLKQKRKAVLKGVPLPVVALWRTSIPTLSNDNYGHSVLKRYVDAGDRLVSCQLATFNIKYNIYTEAYFLPTVNAVTEKMVKMNIDRYFRLGMSNYIPGFESQRIEFKLTEDTYTPSMEEDKGEQRRFWVSCGFDSQITVPLIDDQFFLERLELLIYPVDKAP